MSLSKKTLDRRTVLRGVGAALALPMLDAMVPALSGISGRAAEPVRRLGWVYAPNGMAMECVEACCHGIARVITDTGPACTVP